MMLSGLVIPLATCGCGIISPIIHKQKARSVTQTET